MDRTVEGGFADPVLESQAVFRAIMDALAHPGTPQKLTSSALAQGPLTPELVSGLLTLSDTDTPLWLPDAVRNERITAFIAFHTGAPMVSDPARASFAFAAAAEDLPPLAAFNPGTQDYPDRSTTIVLAVPALTGGPLHVIAGPGIRDHAHFSPLSLPEDFAAQWSANRAIFPRGVDLLLVAEGEVMGLPRSTRLEEGH